MRTFKVEGEYRLNRRSTCSGSVAAIDGSWWANESTKQLVIDTRNGQSRSAFQRAGSVERRERWRVQVVIPKARITLIRKYTEHLRAWTREADVKTYRIEIQDSITRTMTRRKK